MEFNRLWRENREFFRNPSYQERLREVWRETDKTLVGLLWLHLGAALLLTSWEYDTFWFALVFGGFTTLLAHGAYRFAGGTRLSSATIALSIMLYSVIFIQQSLGRIEMHFHVFVGLSFLLAYRDWVPLTVAAGMITVHHLLFNYLQEYGVHFFGMPVVVFNYGCGLEIVFLHAFFVGFEWVVLLLLAGRSQNRFFHSVFREEEIREKNRDLEASRRSLAEAQRIGSMGNWEWDLVKGKATVSDQIYRLLAMERTEKEPGREQLFAAYGQERALELEETLLEMIRRGGTLDAEYPTVAKGAAPWVRIVAEVIREEDGTPVRVIGTVQDVTDRKQAEDLLRNVNARLEKRVEEELTRRREQERVMIHQSRLAAMGEMIGNIAHQWRQPLNALGLKIQDVKDAYDYGELSEEYIDRLTREGMELVVGMSNTIDDFRNFFSPNKAVVFFSPAKGAQDALEILSASLVHHAVQVETSLDPSLTVPGFPNEFSQVVLNLLNNAKDALLEQEAYTRKITVETVDEGNRVAVRISDTGGGIPPEVLEKIFDPYFTTKEEGHGTGIGLYMSMAIIRDNMGGSITAENGRKGAVFTIRLNKKWWKEGEAITAG